MSTAKNERRSICRIKYYNGTVTVFILRILLKFHTYKYMFTAYLRHELGDDQPIKNGTLHGKYYNNNAISLLPFEAFS